MAAFPAVKAEIISLLGSLIQYLGDKCQIQYIYNRNKNLASLLAKSTSLYGRCTAVLQALEANEEAPFAPLARDGFLIERLPAASYENPICFTHPHYGYTSRKGQCFNFLSRMPPASRTGFWMGSCHKATIACLSHLQSHPFPPGDRSGLTGSD